MTHVPERLRTEVIRRAEGRCEYCRLSQIGQEASFHIDHVTPVAAGGETTIDNLALACVSCSLRKGARQTAVDPALETAVDLFHPRRHRWTEHFEWAGEFVRARTSIGAATIALLSLNRPLIVAIRKEESVRGRHPPT
jgi:hypothetical protein